MGKRISKTWPWIVPGVVVGYALVYDFQTAVWGPPFIIFVPACFIVVGLFGVAILGITRAGGWCIRRLKGVDRPQDQPPGLN